MLGQCNRVVLLLRASENCLEKGVDQYGAFVCNFYFV
jgi:hypothetical protein